MMRVPVIVALCVLVSGCRTAEQQRAADEDRCRSYGFKHRNDAFAECLQRLDLDRRTALRRDSIDPWFEPRVIYRPVFVPRPKP